MHGGPLLLSTGWDIHCLVHLEGLMKPNMIPTQTQMILRRTSLMMCLVLVVMLKVNMTWMITLSLAFIECIVKALQSQPCDAVAFHRINFLGFRVDVDKKNCIRNMEHKLIIDECTMMSDVDNACFVDLELD
jgi:hypothetical protein